VSTATASYKGHRYPVEVINQCVWLYFRLPLSFREIEELMLVCGVVVSYETVVRHEVARDERTAARNGGSDERVVPGECSMPVPASTCVTGNGGVWSSEFKPKGCRTIRRLQVRGRPDG
jgi:hypothetical protein